ncbi:MAG: phage tail protein [Nitratireductor sp.]|uniref:phage tail protein n=1 Tax=Nitratireductor sp. TaxID=1872084 RepID=UPI00261D25D4|nr:phage tail protein [Nitratireductor sp.]MCV0352782.1 phage tail protein [Nitratireductor sp.]
MKLWKLLLSAGGSYLAMTAHASADPISIGFFLFAGPLGAAFSFGALVTAAQIGLYAIGIGASLLVSSALSKSQKIDPGQYKNTFENSPEGSEINAIGRCRLGGVRTFGNTRNRDRYRLTCHAKGPMVAIEEYLLGGREVVVDGDTGYVSSPPFAKSGDSWVTFKTKTGTGAETAWPELVSAFPTTWSSAHRVRGIAQSLVKYVSPGIYTEKFGQLYNQGEPESAVTARWNVVYDPREAGADKYNDTTWVWSMNGPLCAARIMLSYPDLTVDSFDWDFIAAEADKADTMVPTLTGTEPRSQCSGVWLSEAKRGDTMKQVLESIGCEVTLSDAGLVRIGLIDDAPTAGMTLTDDHITSYSWRSGPEAAERPNICRISYYSPERGYEMGEIDMTGIAWARVQDEIDRYGEKIYDIELPFCPSASQAQRIARRLFLLARGDTGVVQTNMAGLALWGRDYANITLSDIEETPVCKIAPPRVDDERGQVDIPFTVWPQELIDSPWNPATMEAAAPEQLPNLQYESDLDTPSVASTAVVQYPGGAYETRMRFSSVAGGSTAEANYRTYTGGLPDTWQGMTEYSANGQFAYAAANTVGKEAEFRVRWFNGDGEASYFSDVVNVPDMQIDNSVPAEPYLDVQVTPNGTGDYTFEVVAYSTAMNAVRFVLASNQPEITPGYDGDTRPGLGYTADGTISNGPAAITVTITATVYTSNGTPSPVATFTYVIPQDPNTGP